jgi:hypothetical protein
MRVASKITIQIKDWMKHCIRNIVRDADTQSFGEGSAGSSINQCKGVATISEFDARYCKSSK